MPRWGIDPITIERSDTLQSVLGKLETSENSVPIVVLASSCRIGNNVLLYRLIARFSKRLGLPVAVITSNPYWRRLAREHNLYAFGSLGALKRAKGNSPVSWLEKMADYLIFSMRPTVSKQGWVILVLISMIIGALAYLFIPQLTLTVRIPVETIRSEFQVRIDAGLSVADSSAPVIPGRIMEHRFTVSDFVDSTGDKKVGKARARGEVSIISSDPGVVTLPAGTNLLTASGLRFRTTEAVNLSIIAQPAGPTPATGSQPASSSSGAVKVPVEAVDPGNAGNVPARAISRIEGDAYRNLAVFNERPLTGGSDSKARTITAEDRSRLKEALFQKAQSQSLAELTVRVRQSESLIPHSLQVRIEGEEFDKGVDEEGDRLKGTSYIVASGIAFANQDFNSVVEREWKNKVPKDFRSLPTPPDISPPEVIEAGARTAKLNVKVAGRAEAVLDTDRLTETTRGLSSQEARDKLDSMQGPLKLVNAEVWPDWAQKAYRVEVRTVR